MTQSLLRTIVGTDFDRMPEPVRRMHDQARPYEVSGTSRVMGGTNPLAWLVRVMARLPRPAHRAPIHIDFVPRRESEAWDRRFGKSRFHTIMRREGAHMVEQMTALPVAFIYHVEADTRGFTLHLRGVRCCGLLLPRLFWPSLAARARAWRGRYQFSTVVSFWFCGRVISYFGYLDPPT